eukprot:CAMPEP_0114298166 /NCGR_PEP_ID=MMETSP0059-20121206/12271_1 /TAXON_ID=36894 /ORGANISM="Pyramimonas parkeae, Strain CCMP726" /LENGTH=924 /DNA_ID=CAMNT_0001420505 /DNA_START=503 /DNA_END=3277 /DNA_ORIENTATION=+
MWIPTKLPPPCESEQDVHARWSGSSWASASSRSMAESLSRSSREEDLPCSSSQALGAETAAVVEEVETCTLRTWLDQHVRPGKDPDQTMAVFWQVLKLIGEARGNGVLLRPFRPGNIAMKVVGGEFSVVRVGAKETTQWSFLPCQSADVLEQQWYTHPGGEVVSTQQCDSYGLGVLLYELRFPSACEASRARSMRTLKERLAPDPAEMRAQPQDAARVLWLLQSRPPLAEISRSDLFRDSAAVLPSASSVQPKLAHSEVLVHLLQKMHSLEQESHSQLVRETEDLSHDISLIQHKLASARQARRQQRRGVSMDPPATSFRPRAGASLDGGGSGAAHLRELSPWPAEARHMKRDHLEMSLETCPAEVEVEGWDEDAEQERRSLETRHAMRTRRLITNDFHRFEETYFKLRTSLDCQSRGSSMTMVGHAPAAPARAMADAEESKNACARRLKEAAEAVGEVPGACTSGRGFGLGRVASLSESAGLSERAASWPGRQPRFAPAAPTTQASEARSTSLDPAASTGTQANEMDMVPMCSALATTELNTVGTGPVCSMEGVDTAWCNHLQAFGKTLSSFARYSKFQVLATFQNSALPLGVDMVCSSGFDRDDEFFATVGVCKRVKVFEYAKVLMPEVEVHCPVLEMSSRAKLSSVCWSSYIKSHLASSDYQGTVTLWDAANAVPIMEYEEHKKRAWSVDISQKDPNRILSGSDDGTVKLWHTAQEASVATILGKANVCCVQFSPMNSNLVVFGTADYKSYVYDLRSLKDPLKVLSCHNKTVSYVRFLGDSKLVSASTDNTLKLWDLNSSFSEEDTESQVPSQRAKCLQTIGPSLTYSGHKNEKNFVGLSLSDDGYIACGSEDNTVYAYHHSLPWSMATHKVDDIATAPNCTGMERRMKENVFVSTVCWRRSGNALLVGNSSGTIQILSLV